MKKTGIVGIVVIAIGFLVSILLKINETGIIVSGGIRTFNAIQYIPLVIICIGVVLAIIGVLPFVKAQINEARAVEQEARKLAEKQRMEEKARDSGEEPPEQSLM